MRERLNNLAWEQRLGISTRGVVPIGHPDSVHYATMGYTTIWAVLRQLDLRPDDVFVDVGCGKGRVVCCAARHPVKQVLGVDLSAPLCAEAVENARRLRGRKAPIGVHTMLAQDFDYSPVTVLFMFDPFGAATLGPVLAKLREDTRGHAVRIAYANPSHDEVFQAQPWLERSAFWDRAETGLEHTVSFYRTAT